MSTTDRHRYNSSELASYYCESVSLRVTFLKGGKSGRMEVFKKKKNIYTYME